MTGQHVYTCSSVSYHIPFPTPNRDTQKLLSEMPQIWQKGGFSFIESVQEAVSRVDGLPALISQG